MEDAIILSEIKKHLKNGRVNAIATNKNKQYELICDLTKKELNVILAGGKINYIKEINK